MKRLTTAATMCFSLLGMSVSSQAGLIFEFVEDGGGVRMLSSGEIDVSGLVLDTGTDFWGGIGIEENGNHDILGNTTLAQVDTTYGFSPGTDFSQWASANGPWAQDLFGWVSSGDNKPFTTYQRLPASGSTQLPGLGILSSDLDGTLWSTNQTWFQSGATFASLQMFEGDYTVADAVSGESITFRIGTVQEPPFQEVPAPASLALLGLGLAGIGWSRRKKS